MISLTAAGYIYKHNGMVLCSPSNFPKRLAATGRGTAEAKVKKVSSPEELRQGYAEVPGIWVERCEM